MKPSMKPYLISIPRISKESAIVYAETRGKAKSEVWLDIEGIWPNLNYTDIKARLAKSEDFEKWKVRS